jgi:hypothetical protein
MDFLVAATPLAEASRQNDLVRPAVINARRRQLAFSSTHLRTAA